MEWTPEGYEAAKNGLYEHIQTYLDEHEHSLLFRAYLIMEVAGEGEDERTLCYRSVDVNRKGLKSWDAFGFLQSAMSAVDEQSRQWQILRPDEDDEESGEDES